MRHLCGLLLLCSLDACSSRGVPLDSGADGSTARDAMGDAARSDASRDAAADGGPRDTGAPDAARGDAGRPGMLHPPVEVLDVADVGASVGGFRIELGGDGSLSYAVLGVATLAGAGDVDGDRRDDILVNARRGGSSAGFIVFAPSAPRDVAVLDPADAIRLTGAQLGDSAAGAGDLNGDGFSDVVFGEPGASGLPDFSGGAVSVVLGGPRDELTRRLNDATGCPGGASCELREPTSGTWLVDVPRGAMAGRAVAGGRDMNGDGRPEVVVAAPEEDVGGIEGAGRVYVLSDAARATYGQPLSGVATGSAGFQLEGLVVADRMGQGVALGDVDGDGLADLLLSNARISITGRRNTSIHVVFGRSDLAPVALSSGDASRVIRIGGSMENVGPECGSAGDFDGDGIEDLLFGTDGSPRTAYVIYGNRTRSQLAGIDPEAQLVTLDSPRPDLGIAFFGSGSVDFARHVAAVGDVNRDGFDDILVSARLIDGRNGRAYLIFGRPRGANLLGIDAPDAPDAVPDGVPGIDYVTIQGHGGDFGAHVAGLGDVNGDGRADFGIAAPELGAAFNPPGTIYVIFGADFRGEGG